MGARGPAPKSASELKIAGTYREDRHGDRDQIPEAAGVPKKPRGLKGEAAKHWNAVVPQLVTTGAAKELDTSVLQALCEMWANYRACAEKMQQTPELAIDKNLRCAMLGYLAQWQQLAAKLGLTPADRQRLRVAKSDKPEGVSAFARKRQA